jgi:hypothetical protein
MLKADCWQSLTNAMARYVIPCRFAMCGWGKIMDYDIELFEAVEDLVTEGYLEQPSNAYGVSQKVIHEGYGELTPRQQGLYDAVVVPALIRRAAELKVLGIVNSAAP